MSGDRFIAFLCGILASTLISAQIATSQRIGSDAELSHKQWAGLLHKHVDKTGNVNYKAFKKDEDALADYLSYLGSHNPGETDSRDELLAYYINLYNAATVKLILEHYPVSSIRDIKNPWGRKGITVGDQQYSLNQIEHKILRKMGEPRIHFAINCASVSCPKLLGVPFEAQKLEQQLQDVSRYFINDSLKNRITVNKLSLSALFKWYKSDFTLSGSLAEYISRYSEIPFSPKPKVEFLKYDWRLNEQ